jgi:hypothetical protein
MVLRNRRDIMTSLRMPEIYGVYNVEGAMRAYLPATNKNKE